MGVAVLVISIVGGVVLIQAAVWITLIRRWRKRSAAVEDSLAAEMLATGEHVIIAPEKAVYCGGTGSFSKVRGNGRIRLTDHRVVFQKLTGATVEVPVGTITGTREAKTFLSNRVRGRIFLIIQTSAPAEVGFFVNDRSVWFAALSSLRPTQTG